MCRELAWQPRFDLVAGLKDSYEKDFPQQACPSSGQAADWSRDEQLLAAPLP